MEYILDQLRSPDTSEESSIISDDESDDIIDEDIDIEEEIDESDPVLARNDEMSGFVLLEQKYFSRPIILQQEAGVCSTVREAGLWLEPHRQREWRLGERALLLPRQARG